MTIQAIFPGVDFRLGYGTFGHVLNSSHGDVFWLGIR